MQRERQIEQSLHIWEQQIVPDWTVVHRNPSLRKLWWGGIPAKLRAQMWQSAAGNSLVLSKGELVANYDHERVLSWSHYRRIQDLFVKSQTRIGFRVLPYHSTRSARR